tara:strand:- start:4452 stop:4988 length:537 start_codon:yes stop_codon:yes gene_type:complete
MSGKKGFTRQQRNTYRGLKGLGLTDKQVASKWGVSAGWLSAVKNKRGRFGAVAKSSIQRPPTGTQSFDRFMGGMRSDDPYLITYDELVELSKSGSTPRTRKLAGEKLNSLDGTMSVDDMRRSLFERPVYWRTFKGVRVKLLLGRTKAEVVQESIRKQLAAKGIFLKKGEYVDYGGYGG